MRPDPDSSGCLFLVATPIGNLGDLSARASCTIKDCDIIACEDTRVSSKLLNHLKLRIPMVSYREENEKKKSQEIAARKLKIIPIPGPNAALTALAASGLPTHQFAFIGFLPKKSGQVKKTLQFWQDFDGSVILYESKYKIEKTLSAICETLGPERYVCLARELTKSYESIFSGPIEMVIQEQSQSSGKGEFTLVIGPSDYTF